MSNKKWWTPLASLMAVIVCSVAASPAHAYHWFWQKNSTPAASQPGPAPASATPANPAPAAQASAPAPAAGKPASIMAADPKTVASSKIYGTVESIDAANERLNLKTNAGKTESFTLSKSSMIFEHHKKLTLSSLKIGERVSVHYQSGTSEASRVYVLEDKKA